MNINDYKRKKSYFADIWIWLLILLKIYKTIAIIKIITGKKMRNIIIMICASMSSMWFLYFIENTHMYELPAALEAIGTVALIAGFGAYIIYMTNNNKINKKVLVTYASVLIIIGVIDMSMDLSFIGNTSFSNIVLGSSILCEAFYIIAGSIIMFSKDK
tara:strand:- start:411 stop:887 length:477 start_codon:yes stop_codon:yes gene_type:complete